jgi:hypothetical protein
VERTIKLTISEDFSEKAKELGITEEQFRSALGYATVWGAMHEDATDDQLDLWLTHEAIISCWYRNSAALGGATKFYMAGHPAPHNASGYSFHS